MAKLVSKTYGEALFKIALEENKASVFLEEAESILQIVRDNPDFNKLMLHPAISKQEKQQVMDTVFEGRISGEMLGFLKLIVQKERYRELEAVCEHLIARIKEVQKVGIAYVTTATELTDEWKEQVKQRILETTDYLTMEMHYRVDPQIIGGMIIRIGDRVVDSSIRSRLDDMTRQLLQIQLG